MKLSKTPTGVVIVKAQTNSSFDSIDFALVYPKKEDLLSKLSDAESIASKYYGSNGLEFREDIEWYTEDVDDEDMQEVLDSFLKGSPGDEDWSHIEISDEEVELLNTPSQDVCYGTYLVEQSGSVWFRGWGKHSNDEFFTERIPIKEL